MQWLRIAIYALVVAFAIFAFAASEIWPSRADLWLNLFAEAIGVAFIVVVVENLIRISEQRRSRPARYAAFKETLLIYNRLVGLWFQMIQSAFRPEMHGHLLAGDALRLLDARFGEVAMRLYLDAEAPVRPKRNWRYFLSHQVDDIERIIDRCLQRYSAFMEPEVIQCLQELERTSFFTYAKLQPSLPTIAEELGRKHSPFFGWGGKSSAADLIDPLNRLGSLLAAHRIAFEGMPDIPEKVELDHPARIDTLRKSASDPGTSPPVGGVSAGDVPASQAV
ncbi:MAG: hypothetical protein P1U88_17990 [Thalassobaculaceae bacterium]|nr:hypothetical protein [Thalassobaculaceae bacterium]